MCGKKSPHFRLEVVLEHITELIIIKLHDDDACFVWMTALSLYTSLCLHISKILIVQEIRRLDESQAEISQSTFVLHVLSILFTVELLFIWFCFGDKFISYEFLLISSFHFKTKFHLVCVCVQTNARKMLAILL